MRIEKGQKVKIYNIRKSNKREKVIIAIASSYKGRDEENKAIYNRWRISFAGNAYEKALKIRENDHILLLSSRIDSDYNFGKEKLYIMITAYEIEII